MCRLPWQPRLFADVPLALHCHYSRDELLVGLDAAGLERKPTSDMQGVRFVRDLNADVFTFTLKKSERDYSPTTMYRDYVMSPDLVHWESQLRRPPIHRPDAATSTARAPCCSLLAKPSATRSARGHSCSLDRHRMCHTKAVDRSRSFGALRSPCRPTSTLRPGFSRAEKTSARALLTCSYKEPRVTAGCRYASRCGDQAASRYLKASSHADLAGYISFGS